MTWEEKVEEFAEEIKNIESRISRILLSIFVLSFWCFMFFVIEWLIRSGKL